MAKLSSINPSNYTKLGEVDVSTDSDISTGVNNARSALDQWCSIGISKRIEYMKEVYSAFESKKKELSKLASTEMGFPISQQEMFDLGDGFNYFKWYLENSEKYLEPETTFESDNELHRVFYEPTGVAAIIQPWNFPFCQWSWTVVPNLIAGNTVVFKHSEEVPLFGKMIEETIDGTSLPKGVFNEVYGNGKVGEILTNEDIDLICFTGSYKVGQKIYEKAAEKFIKALIELGGSAPGIVFEDADKSIALESIYGLRFTNCGQACDGLKRLIVHESLLDSVVEALKKIIKSKKMGDPLDPSTDFGPLVAKRQQDLIIAQIEDALSKGAKVETGGKIPKNLNGAYFEPTIITGITKDMRVWKEEVFGPVLPVVSYRTEEEAVELANDTAYGLGGYIYTKDLKKAEIVAAQIKTGMVSINGTNYVCPFNPFGGYKHSGLGRAHGKYGLHDLCQIKVVAVNK